MFRFYSYLVLIILLSTGCRNEENTDILSGDIKLEINTSIEHKSIATKAIISESDFPASVTGETSSIGMFLMNDKYEPYEYKEDNLLAEVKGFILPDKSKHYEWSYKLNDGVTPLDHLSVLPGTNFQLFAYYPRVKDATYDAVPFDLSVPVNEEEQTDILYSPQLKLKADNSVQTQPIHMQFKHLFALIEFQIKAQSGQQNMKIREVQIENNGRGQWIKNKGYFNPQTGEIRASSYGPINILCDKTLSSDTESYIKIQILVPPFINWNYQNGDVMISFYSERGQISPTTQLSLSNEQVTYKGFEGGKKYTYKLSYDNNMFRIDDWFVNAEVTDNSIGK